MNIRRRPSKSCSIIPPEPEPTHVYPCRQTDFIARHCPHRRRLGRGEPAHLHHYVLELQLSGETLDQHGYLADIVEIERLLEETIARYREQMLNDLPEFAG